MGLFNKNKRKGGFMDEIRCDEPSYLIWKWHPAGAGQGNNKMIDTVSKTFFLEDIDDPVAINMFSNSSLYELFNDENIADNLETDEDIYGDDIDEEEFFDDIMQDTSTSQIDIDVDEDIKVNNDLSDENGEIIDMVDGLI